MIYRILLYTVAMCFLACGQQGNQEQALKELSLQKQELELKERELLLREKEIEAKKISNEQLQQSKLSNSKSLSSLYQDIKKSVYIIYAITDDGYSQGSAFVLDRFGLAVSNYHVIENANDLYAENDKGQKYMITQIYSYSKENDYVIFRIGEQADLDYLSIATTNAEIGEECFTIGTPKGLSFTLSKGIVSGYREDSRFIQTTTEITHGSSGGPLINNDGKVIGITTSGLGQANLNFAVNVSYLPLASLLNRQSFVNESSQSKQVKSSDIKDIVYRYYNVLDNKDYNQLYNFYASTLLRYYSKYDISANEAVKIARNYNEIFKVRSIAHNIRSNTFSVRNVDNYFVANFVMDYTLDRYDKNKDSHFVLQIVMVLTPQGKILSVYENILAKA